MITDKEKQKEYLDIIQSKSKRMNDLIELLFEYVKIDSEGFKLEKEEYDLIELLRENGAKDIFNDVMKEATKEGKIFYTHLKKFIIYVIKKLQETNQYKQAEKMMNVYVQKI